MSASDKGPHTFECCCLVSIEASVKKRQKMECVDQADTNLSTLQNAHKQQWWSRRLCTLFLFLLCGNTKDCDVIHSETYCANSPTLFYYSSLKFFSPKCSLPLETHSMQWDCLTDCLWRCAVCVVSSEETQSYFSHMKFTPPSVHSKP